MSTEKIDIRREDRFAAELKRADRTKNFVRLERFREPAKKARHRMVNGDPLSSDPVSEFGESFTDRIKREKRSAIQQCSKNCRYRRRGGTGREQCDAVVSGNSQRAGMVRHVVPSAAVRVDERPRPLGRTG